MVAQTVRRVYHRLECRSQAMPLSTVGTVGSESVHGGNTMRLILMMLALCFVGTLSAGELQPTQKATQKSAVQKSQPTQKCERCQPHRHRVFWRFRRHR